MHRVVNRLAQALCSTCVLLAVPFSAAAKAPRDPPPSDSALAAAAPLPEANDFMRGLAERQRGREEALNRYTYDVLEVEEQLDKKGAVKERKSRGYEVFHVKGHSVRRQVTENERPLAAEKLADVDKKVQKEIADIDKKAKDDEKKEEDDAMKLSAILARYDFRAVAREYVLGRPAIVVDFAARPGKWKVEADNVLRNLTGRMWIDEDEREIVRAEVHNTGGIKIAFGLGASLSQLAVTLEFQRMDDEVWLPSRVEGRVVGRVLLVKGIRVRTVATYSRYRRFQVETDEAVTPPVPLQ